MNTVPTPPVGTLDEFQANKAAQIGQSLESLHAEGFFGYRALYCSMEGCEGWHWGTPESFKMEQDLAAMIARKST